MPRSGAVRARRPIPTVSSTNDPNAIEVGLKFESTTSGYIDGIRFYKGAGNTGAFPVGHLWDSQWVTCWRPATFSDETDSGLATGRFPARQWRSQADTMYVASYFSPNGHYAGDAGYFTTSETDNGPLRALTSPESGGNGVYVYGSSRCVPRPTQGNAANYWVDVVFTPAPDTTPPTVLSTSPESGATNVDPRSSVTASFSEAVQPGTIRFVLTDPSNNVIAATLTYDPATQTETRSAPNSPLAYGTTYTATLSGSQDLAGNVMTSVSWSFTTMPAPDTTPPTVVSTSPASGATGVDPGSSVTASFSEEVQSGTISFVLTDPSNNVIAATDGHTTRRPRPRRLPPTHHWRTPRPTPRH